MDLYLENLTYINTITHEGKVLLFATSSDHKIWYTVKQDGFEDTALSGSPTAAKGWENWQELPLPDEEQDPSVLDWEAAKLTYTEEPEKYFLRPRYRTADQSATSPVQLVSGLGHLYVFRQSREDADPGKVSPHTLLVDRFVLDGMTNQLVRKFDVRFKRSGQKYKPYEGAQGGYANQFDSLDFRDTDGNPFYEPTTELSLVNSLQEGWFSVVLLPTNEHDKYRWHIFAYNREIHKVELFSIRGSEDGLFDFTDETILAPSLVDPTTLAPHAVPGIIRRTLDLKDRDANDAEITVTQGISATKYDLQVEREIGNGEKQLLRDSTRIMLVVPTGQGSTVALTFAVALDGTLAQINSEPDQTPRLRDRAQELLLPVNTLDEIKAIGAGTPSPRGQILGLERGSDDLVVIRSPNADLLQNQTGIIMVMLSGTSKIDGHYTVKSVSNSAFTIDAPGNNVAASDTALGQWELLPTDETNLVSDGMITAYTLTDNHQLRLTAINHELVSGDDVQIENLEDYEGVYTVTPLDRNHFGIDAKWQAGEAVKLARLTEKRRGINFDGNDSIMVGPLPLQKPLDTRSFGYTFETWIRMGQNSDGSMVIVENGGSLQLQLVNGALQFQVVTPQGTFSVKDPAPLPQAVWTHFAMRLFHDPAQPQLTLSFCKNGVEVDRKQFSTERPNPIGNQPDLVLLNWRAEFEIGQQFVGQIADFRIWDEAREVNSIKNSMYLQLTGREIGLVGYWRMGGISESRVFDFSIHGNDGTVNGDPYVSAVSLSRTLGDGTTPAVRYANEELFAVTQRATYEESFEFKLDDENLDPDHVDGEKLFKFTYWGKRSRRSEEKSAIGSLDGTSFQLISDGWWRATGRFTVPEDVNLVRTFEISEVQGSWSTLEIRKHRIMHVSDSVTEAQYYEAVPIEMTDPTMDAVALENILDEMIDLEKEEAAMLFEYRRLDRLITDSGKSDDEKQRILDEKQEAYDELVQREARAKADYEFELANPLNYWCTIKNENYQAHTTQGFLELDLSKEFDQDPETTGGMLKIRNKREVVTERERPEDIWCQIWCFEPSGIEDYYYIRSGLSRLYAGPPYNQTFYLYQGPWLAQGFGLVGVGDKENSIKERPQLLNMFRFKLETLPGADQGFHIKNYPEKIDLRPANVPLPEFGFVFGSEVPGYLATAGGMENEVGLSQPFPNNLTQVWRFSPAQDQLDRPTTLAIENALTIWEDVKAELEIISQELAAAKEAYQAGETQIGEWQTQRDFIKTQLEIIQLRLSSRNTVFVENIHKQEKDPVQMKPLESHDLRGLQVQAACLDFVRPSSPISAVETSEGNVQLSYFDDRGRLRLTKFDATSDSTNPIAVQWIPDTLRTCLYLDQNQNVITLDPPVSLGEKWTIEAQFCWPPPVADGWNALSRHVLFHNQSKLGSYTNLNGREPGLLAYFPLIEADGDQVTDLVQKRIGTLTEDVSWWEQGPTFEGQQRTALNFEGDAVLTLEASPVSLGEDWTIEAWFSWPLPDTELWNTFTRGMEADHHIIVQNRSRLGAYISAQGGFLDCGFDALASLSDGWHHIAAVGSGSGTGAKTNFYLDGQPVGSIDAKSTQDVFAIGNYQGGGQPFGKIADFRIWKVALTTRQITENRHGGIFKDCGYELDKLSDGWHHLAPVAQGAEKEATTIFYIDGRRVGYIDAKCIENLSAIGNFVTDRSVDGDIRVGDRPFGKLAEVRVWNVALSDAEIAVNSVTTLSGNEPDLLAYYPLDEADGIHTHNHAQARFGVENNEVKGASWWAYTLPNGLDRRTGLNFENPDSMLTLDPPIALPASWTIEAWFSWPLPDSESWNTLTRGVNSDHHIIIKDRSRLGTFLNNAGGFHDCGYELLDNLTPGLHHIAAVGTGSEADAKTAFYLDGQQVGSIDAKSTQDVYAIGNYQGGGQPFGIVSQLRIWGEARTEAQITQNSRKMLLGTEPNLLANFPLNELADDQIRNRVLNGAHSGRVANSSWWVSRKLKDVITSRTVVSAEYSTVGTDPNQPQRRVAMLRRFLAIAQPRRVQLLPDKRIEALDLKWIGNAQFEPTLLGYIEGAPPVPSENLTVETPPDYNGATSVSLKMAEEVTYSWTREQQGGLGSSLSVFAGAKTDLEVLAIILVRQLFSAKTGFEGKLDISYDWLNRSIISSASSLETVDRLELRGAPEPGIKFTNLGQRFVPKNVGYALVVSGLADVYITRLRRSGRMMGYQLLPNPDIPPDVNTITFLINPAYTMNGSLDGLTGSQATSDRYFRHVPEMRAQYGSMVPASYYRLKEAYSLKALIDEADVRRASYFANFNSRLVDENSLVVQAEAPEYTTPEITVGQAADQQDGEDQASAEPNSDQVQTQVQDSTRDLQSQSDVRAQQIQQQIEDQEQLAHARASLEGWQRRMENLQIRASKRNIVNNYIWDGDGGWRAESQQFADTIEHSIGGSFQIQGSAGAAFGFSTDPLSWEFHAAATFKLTQTMTKTINSRRGFSLDVDLSGVEHIGITDYNDDPLFPGEKVDRYRFMSFYLEGSTKNFQDFFQVVVDPEWLASNDEEARALRQINQASPNQAWRVLHRVTYVERPALMNFGKDTRPLGGIEERVWYFASVGGLYDEVEKLMAEHGELEAKLDLILQRLAELSRRGGGGAGTP